MKSLTLAMPGRPAAWLPALLAAAACAAAQAQQVVQIGLTSPLSGPQSAYGWDNRDGLLLAVRELNARPVMVGGQRVTFEVVAEDDAADPRQGVAVARKLADQKLRFVLGPYNSGVAIPAARVYDEAGIVVLTVGSNPKITQLGYARLFRIGGNDVQVGATMAGYAARELKLRSVAVLDDRTAYGQGLAAEFMAEARRLGIDIVRQEFTTDRATDFTAVLTALRAARPEAIFFGGYSAQAGPLLRQMVSLGIKARLLGGDGICDTETHRLSGGLADGRVLCLQARVVLDKSEAGRAFAARYREAYKREPLTYAANFYDGAMLLADAMQKAGSTEPGPVAAQLARGSWRGVAAEYAFTERHDLKYSPLTVYGFEGGQPRALSTY